MSDQIPFLDDERDSDTGAPDPSRPALPGERPWNRLAEEQLLGALLANNAAMSRVEELIRAECFYMPVHGRIYEAIRNTIEKGQVANAITLKPRFDADPDLKDVGGAEYLADLTANVISVAYADSYARALHELHMRRELIDLGEEMAARATRGDEELATAQQIEEAEKSLFTLATAGQIGRDFEPLSASVRKAIDLAEKAFHREGEVTGVTTGLDDVDRMMGGLHPSDLIILAARPSMGKTSLAINIATNAARAFAETEGRDGAAAGVMSLEMSSEQLAGRILADVSEVPSDRMRRGDLSEQDFPKFVNAATQMASWPLFIDDTPALTVGAVRTRARRLKRQHNLGLLIIDYLQLLSGSSRGGEANRVQEISEISRGLKAIAKELDIPVLALSQLSRQVENREDKRPQLSDLRESGSIEQDADVVMFIYREEYYLARTEPHEGTPEHEAWMAKMNEYHNIADIIVAKQRHGPIGTRKVQFDSRYTRFSNLEKHHQDAFGPSD